jgi:hypothetical protein
LFVQKTQQTKSRTEIGQKSKKNQFLFEQGSVEVILSHLRFIKMASV